MSDKLQFVAASQQRYSDRKAQQTEVYWTLENSLYSAGNKGTAMNTKHFIKLMSISLFLFALVSLSTTRGMIAAQDEQQRLAQQAVAIIQSECLKCHGGDKTSGLDLRSQAGMLKGGLRGGAVIPGKSAESLLYQFISGAKSLRMPLGETLADDEIEIIKNWIDKGAVWPEILAIKPVPTTFKEKEITAEHRQYWAFAKPVRSEIPKINGITNPIDAFIQAELAQKNLTSALPADKATLLRRVTFDLTGLPPTPEEIKVFLNDKAPNAYEKIVDRLLASPRYGERWAQHWLDVVRFGESNGFELDAERPQAWRYRDYVVNALNADKPYDRFIQEQIAGDELAPDDFEAQVATGFLRTGPQHVVAGNLDKAELRQEYLTETMLGLGSGIMGLTVGCARCHDHKFDPILQADFYKLQAFFAATDNDSFSNAPFSELEKYQAAMKAHKEKLQPITAQIEEIEQPFQAQIKEQKRKALEPKYAEALNIPKDKRTPEQKEDAKYAERMLEVKYEELLQVMPAEAKAKRAALRRQMHDLVWQEPPPLPKALAVADRLLPLPASYIFKGGAVHAPTREVQPQFPKVLLPSTETNNQASIAPLKSSTGRRLVLAQWLTSPNHPLTARVIVNRLWQHHFGRGLVATPNDFGRNGAGVTNQSLLDWLALELIDGATGRRGDGAIPPTTDHRPPTTSPWSLKHLHKLMVLSKTYQQSSANDPAKAIIDPENKLLWRANRQRLDAEALRDSILVAAGTLNEQFGGPSIRVPMEPEVVETIFTEYEPDNLWPVHPDPKQHTRRSLYLFRKRNVKLPMLVAFDTPDLQSVCGARNVSVHSLQALTLMNSDFMQQQSQALASRILREAQTTQTRLARLYALTIGRAPRVEEIKAATIFLKENAEIIKARKIRGETIAELKDLPKQIDAVTAAAWIDLCLATLNLNEFVYVK